MKSIACRSYVPFTYIVTAFFGLYVFWYAKQQLFFVHTVVCTVFGASSALSAEIKLSLELIKNNGASSIAQSIVQSFPMIDELYVKRTVDQTLWCDARVKSIAYCINEKIAVDNTGAFYSMDLFDQQLMTDVKKCFVNDHFLQKGVPTVLFHALNMIDTFFFTHYVLYIEDKYHAFLLPTDPALQYSVCFEMGKAPKRELIEKAIKQLPVVVLDKRMNEKKKKRTVIDIRFANQLIFYKEKKEML